MLSSDLIFELQASKIESSIILVSHLCAIIAVSLSGLPLWVRFILIFILAGYGLFCFYYIGLKHSKKSPEAFSLLDNNQCAYRLKNQKVHIGERQHEFVTHFLIVLKIKSARRVQRLVVFKDALSSKQYHVLLRALKV